MSIANKLTYLGETKIKIKDSINLTGIGITNEPFRQYSTKLKDAYVDIINNGTETLYSNFPKVSGEDTNLSLTPTYQAPLLIVPKGNTSQTGTPTPSSPIMPNRVCGDNDIVVCGKNILPLSSNDMTLNIYINSDTGGEATSASGNYYGNFSYIPFNYSNETITLSTGLELAFYDNAKTFISYAGRLTNRTQVVPNNTAYIRIDCYKDNINEMQIELGNQSSTYEPYTGTTYNIDLPVENLFDSTQSYVIKTRNTNVEQITNGYKIIMTNAGDRFKIAYFLIPNSNKLLGKTLSLSYTANASSTNDKYIGVFYYSSLTYEVQLAGDSTAPITIASSFPSGFDNLALLMYANRETNNVPANSYVEYTNIMLELGSKKNTYTPYGTTPIELCKIGTYQDYIYKENDKWYKHNAIGKYKLLSTDLLSIGGKNATEGYIECSFPSKVNDATMYCNMLGVENLGATIDNSNKIGFTNISTNQRIRIRLNTGLLNLNDSKTMVNNNDFYFYYQIKLYEQTNTEITYTPLINQLNTLEEAQSKDGTTNINQVNNDLPFIINASALEKE